MSQVTPTTYRIVVNVFNMATAIRKFPALTIVMHTYGYSAEDARRNLCRTGICVSADMRTVNQHGKLGPGAYWYHEFEFVSTRPYRGEVTNNVMHHVMWREHVETGQKVWLHRHIDIDPAVDAHSEFEGIKPGRGSGHGSAFIDHSGVVEKVTDGHAYIKLNASGKLVRFHVGDIARVETNALVD